MLAVLTLARLAMGFQFRSIGSTAPLLFAGTLMLSTLPFLGLFRRLQRRHPAP